MTHRSGSPTRGSLRSLADPESYFADSQYYKPHSESSKSDKGQTSTGGAGKGDGLDSSRRKEERRKGGEWNEGPKQGVPPLAKRVNPRSCPELPPAVQVRPGSPGMHSVCSASTPLDQTCIGSSLVIEHVVPPGATAQTLVSHDSCISMPRHGPRT